MSEAVRRSQKRGSEMWTGMEMESSMGKVVVEGASFHHHHLLLLLLLPLRLSVGHVMRRGSGANKNVINVPEDSAYSSHASSPGQSSSSSYSAHSGRSACPWHKAGLTHG